MEVAVLVAHFWYVIRIVVVNCANTTASDVISIRPDFLSMHSDLDEKEKFVLLLSFSEFLLDNVVFSGPSFLCASLLSTISDFFFYNNWRNNIRTQLLLRHFVRARFYWVIT